MTIEVSGTGELSHYFSAGGCGSPQRGGDQEGGGQAH